MGKTKKRTSTSKRKAKKHVKKDKRVVIKIHQIKEVNHADGVWRGRRVKDGWNTVVAPTQIEF